MDINLDEYEVDSALPAESPKPITAEDDELTAEFQDLEPTVKVRRTVPKLDAGRLLSARGYPALLQKLRNVKYKGRGRERRYLEAYLVTYQLWSNRLWPKAKLTDFITMARGASKSSEIRKYCRDLIEKEQESSFSNVNRDPSTSTTATTTTTTADTTAADTTTADTTTTATSTNREDTPVGKEVTSDNQKNSEEHGNSENEQIPDEPVRDDIPDPDLEPDLYADFDF